MYKDNGDAGNPELFFAKEFINNLDLKNMAMRQRFSNLANDL